MFFVSIHIDRTVWHEASCADSPARVIW